jgi:hypothetical protein
MWNLAATRLGHLKLRDINPERKERDRTKSDPALTLRSLCQTAEILIQLSSGDQAGAVGTTISPEMICALKASS